jgi:hypothetical protein
MKKILPFAIIVLIVAGAALYMSSLDDGSTNRKDQTDFAIADTASVGTIFIADMRGRSVTLDRHEGFWMVNDTFVARPDAVQLLLATFKNVYVQRPVTREGQEQVNRIMASSAKKVEVYDLSYNLIKTWYVGHGTMDKKGTYMLLETPEFGKAAAPYILDMKGFLGMLDTRFFTDLHEWRSVRFFDYPDMQLKTIEVDYPGQPEASFRIEYGGGNDIKLYAKDSTVPFDGFDSTVVKDYMLNFKLASFENFNTLLSPAQEDSVMAHTPYQVISVEDRKQRKVIRLWPKSPPANQTEMDGETLSTIDRERVYAATSNNELALAQRYTWEAFRAPLQVFSPISKP